MSFLDSSSRLLLNELLSAACSEGVEVFKRNKQAKYSTRALKKVSQSPSLSFEAAVNSLLSLWTCRGKWAGVYVPIPLLWETRAFSSDSQIQWLLSVSPSYNWLCGMKTIGSQLGAMALSTSLLESVLVLVRRNCPKAAPFHKNIPKSLFQVLLNWAENYSWEDV